MMTYHMTPQSRLKRKTLATKLTNEGLLPSVQSTMSVQVRLVVEPFAADVANVIALLLVSSLVAFVVGQGESRVGAELAVKSLGFLEKDIRPDWKEGLGI